MQQDGSGTYRELYEAYSLIPEFVAFEATGWDFAREVAAKKSAGYQIKWATMTEADRKTITGFYAAVVKGDSYHLWLLGVRPEFRGLGCSHQLLKYFIDNGRNEGFTTFTTKTYSDRPAMVRALERMGFQLERMGFQLESGDCSGEKSELRYRLELRAAE